MGGVETIIDNVELPIAPVATPPDLTASIGTSSPGTSSSVPVEVKVKPIKVKSAVTLATAMIGHLDERDFKDYCNTLRSLRQSSVEQQNYIMEQVKDDIASKRQRKSTTWFDEWMQKTLAPRTKKREFQFLSSPKRRLIKPFEVDIHIHRALHEDIMVLATHLFLCKCGIQQLKSQFVTSVCHRLAQAQAQAQAEMNTDVERKMSALFEYDGSSSSGAINSSNSSSSGSNNSSLQDLYSDSSSNNSVGVGVGVGQGHPSESEAVLMAQAQKIALKLVPKIGSLRVRALCIELDAFHKQGLLSAEESEHKQRSVVSIMKPFLVSNEEKKGEKKVALAALTDAALRCTGLATETYTVSPLFNYLELSKPVEVSTLCVGERHIQERGIYRGLLEAHQTGRVQL